MAGVDINSVLSVMNQVEGSSEGDRKVFPKDW
jgi:hypothetical protein